MNLNPRRKTAIPVQITAFFGVELGFFGYAVDAGLPLPSDDFHPDLPGSSAVRPFAERTGSDRRGLV
jgi:hypothetical protein